MSRIRLLLILILFAAGVYGVRPAFAFVGGVVNPATSGADGTSALKTDIVSMSTVKTGLTTPSTKTNVPHPFFFTENRGQWNSRVLYKCVARNGMTWFLERDGFTLLVTKTAGANGIRSDNDRRGGSLRPPEIDPMDRDLPEMMRKHPARYPMQSHALKFKFVNAFVGGVVNPATNSADGTTAFSKGVLHTPTVKTGLTTPSTNTCTAKSIEPQGELSWCNNYFLGNDSSKWAPNCRNFTNVMMREVWEGIDIEWYENDGKVEFDFIVHPGFDASQIRIECEGQFVGGVVNPANNSADGTSATSKGILHTPTVKTGLTTPSTNTTELILPLFLG